MHSPKIELLPGPRRRTHTPADDHLWVHPSSLLLLCCVLCSALFTGGCGILRTPEPLIVRQVVINTPAGICRGFVCTVDLKSPRVRVVLADGRDDAYPATPAESQPPFTVDDWAARTDATVAINAGRADRLDAAPANLLARGETIALSARDAPTDRQARSAIGTGNNGRTLILAAIDGGDPEWSVGMTLPELAHLLLSSGATDARTLPSSESTSFIFRPATMFARYSIKPETISNRPSGNAPRSAIEAGVATPSHFPLVRNVIGVFVRPRTSDFSAAPCAGCGFD